MESTIAEKAVIARQNKDARKASAAELRSQRMEMQKAINELRNTSPETTALVDMWSGAIDFWKQELIGSLQARAGQGKSPQINITSQEFLAFVLGDLIKDKLPELAALTCGSGGVSAGVRLSQLSALNGRLAAINAELAGLGEV